MKAFGYYWGISGVLLILLFAIVRLSLRVLDMLNYSLNLWQWLSLILFALYMAYAEGYKGFHLNFAPRVIIRAKAFLEKNSLKSFLYVILAPLLCMGYIYATKKRKLISFILTGAIITLVLLVRMLPQPWRGIVDAGVVLGLFLGVCSIVYFWVQSLKDGWVSPVPADFSESRMENKIESK
ncbi:MAG: hypothetical protein P8J61_03085 [Gammaproteobacteria bacterium]|nr:hypothetical protein [Gammaproteobacteria bacterium]